MSGIDQLIISWDGPANSSLLDDIASASLPDDDLRDQVVLSKKTVALKDPVTAIAAAAGLAQIAAVMPMVTGILGVALLASLSPIALHRLSDQESALLQVIERLQTGDYLRLAHLQALLKSEKDADLLISALCEKGFLLREADGKLKIQRKVVAGLEID